MKIIERVVRAETNINWLRIVAYSNFTLSIAIITKLLI